MMAQLQRSEGGKGEDKKAAKEQGADEEKEDGVPTPDAAPAAGAGVDEDIEV